MNETTSPYVGCNEYCYSCELYFNYSNVHCVCFPLRFITYGQNRGQPILIKQCTAALPFVNAPQTNTDLLSIQALYRLALLSLMIAGFDKKHFQTQELHANRESIPRHKRSARMQKLCFDFFMQLEPSLDRKCKDTTCPSDETFT